MRGAALLLLAVAACGKSEAPAPAPANNAVPVLEAAPIVNQGNVAEAAPKPEPLAPKPAKPVPSRPAPVKPADYRAIGTEPFWAVTVRGTRATLERPDAAPVRFAVAVRNDGPTIRYVGEGFTMMLSAGPCSDGMSDAIWSDRVQIAFAGGTLKGCGGAREDMGQERP